MNEEEAFTKGVTYGEVVEGTAYISDLFTDPAFRRQGGCSAMMRPNKAHAAEATAPCASRPPR